MNRKTFLKGIGIGAASVAVGGVAIKSGAKFTRADFNETKAGWQNWSELYKCNPTQIASPTSEAQLAEIMASAKQVRFAGTGHSFMPLIPTDQTIISLDAFSGVVDYDSSNKTARVKAGSKLALLGREFSEKGQAFINLPDINTQTLAGALSTATHGTGKDYMAMHAYVKGIKLLTPQGELIECNENQNEDVFQAAKVSLGALGAITEYTLQNREAYNLHRVVTIRSLDWVLKNGYDLMQKNDQFEFYYIPHTKLCVTIEHNESSEPIRPRATTEDEDFLALLKSLRDWLYWAPSLRQNAVKLAVEDGQVLEDYVDDSWRLMSQSRVSKFIESEYHIPYENAFDCLKKVIEYLDSRKDTYFPLEMRVIKKDNAWLTPFQQDTCSIAVHTSYEEEYEYLIKDIGPIYKSFGGRPHWGKMNDFTKADFKKAYPHWDDFLAVREKCDPDGKLLNEYLKSIFI